MFKGLSEPLRLRIMNLLCEQEACVCHLVSALGIIQPKISRHLAYLKKTGVVKVRREGKWMHYAWAAPSHPAARAVLDSLRQWMLGDPRLTAERRKARPARCD